MEQPVNRESFAKRVTKKMMRKGIAMVIGVCVTHPFKTFLRHRIYKPFLTKVIPSECIDQGLNLFMYGPEEAALIERIKYRLDVATRFCHTIDYYKCIGNGYYEYGADLLDSYTTALN